MRVIKFTKRILSLAAFSIVIFGCENPTDLDNPSDEIKDIEKSYSSVKIENGKPALTIEEREKAIMEQFVKFTSRYRSAKDVSGGYDVGVLPVVAGCPLNSELVKVLLDAEDDTPHDTYQSGNAISWYKDTWGDLIMYYCKVDGRQIAAAGGYFSVVRFCPNVPTSAIAPLSSIQQSHFTFDTEDDGHTRWIEPTTAAIAAPNVVDGHNNFALFLFTYNNPGTVAMPDYGFSYAVLAGYTYSSNGPTDTSLKKFGTGTAYRGLWYLDTEDHDTGDFWSFDAGPAPQLYISKSLKIIYDENGTGPNKKGVDFNYAIVR